MALELERPTFEMIEPDPCGLVGLVPCTERVAGSPRMPIALTLMFLAPKINLKNFFFKKRETIER